MAHNADCPQWFIPANTTPFCSGCGQPLDETPRCSKCRSRRITGHNYCPMCGTKHDG